MRAARLIPVLALVLAAGALFVMQGKDARARMAEIETFEIEIGEPVGDAVARSTRKYDFRIPLDMHSLDIPGMDAPPGSLEIILRNGAGKSAALPWQPVQGSLWMYVGVTDELNLEFSGFGQPTLRGEAVVPAGAPPLEAEVLGISEIYARVMTLTGRPRERSNCYRNDLELQDSPCERVTLVSDRQSPEALQRVLRDFHAGAAEEDWRDRDKNALMLNLGQWWLPNGSLAMMVVVAVPQPDGGIDPVTGRDLLPPRLVLHLSVNDYFNSQIARLMLSCYDQQAIFPEKITYSQAQAAQIFHGLYADFFPPVVDGVEVTDRIALASLDWGPLSDSYANEPAVRQRFCDLVQHLEREAGYNGPIAPRH